MFWVQTTRLMAIHGKDNRCAVTRLSSEPVIFSPCDDVHWLLRSTVDAHVLPADKISSDMTTCQVPRIMDYRVSYEHSLKNDPDDFIVHVPSQLINDIPANIPRALLPEYITDLILKRSPQIGKIRNLRIL